MPKFIFEIENVEIEAPDVDIANERFVDMLRNGDLVHEIIYENKYTVAQTE